jgi:beta-galactosidase
LINAELTDFGFPEWVLLDPAVQARTSVGSLHLDAAWGFHPPHQFPVPSYASEAFYTYIEQWFTAICPIIVRHLAPHGNIVAVQSDNETCYLFHDRAYATDYSEDSLALYRTFLQERYTTIETLNAAYHTAYQCFEEVAPPHECQVRTRDDMAWHVDWVTYKEYQIRWCVARIARMLRSHGIQNVPIFHDVAFQFRTPLDITRMEAEPDIDWVGMNLYRNKEGHRGATQSIRYLAGSTRLPFVPELGCGIWSHHPLTPTPDEQEFITLLALMYGMKAFNLYMLVERERWQGSPITRHGTFRPEYADFYRRLLAFAQSYQLWSLQRTPHVLVLLNYDMGRYAALASSLHFAHADLYGLPRALFQLDLDLDLQWDVDRESDDRRYDNWLGTVIRHLENSHLDYNLSDTHVDLNTLNRYPFVIVPTVDFMDAEDQRRLLAYVEQGGQLIIGPGIPALDPALHPCEVIKKYVNTTGKTALESGNIWWVPQNEIAATLEGILIAEAFQCDNPNVQLALHQNARHRLLFITNTSSRAQEAMLSFPDRWQLHQVWGTERIATAATTLTLKIKPYTVQIWEVQHD